MVNPMVERATSDMLIGPDWAMNIEICDICNHDPAQAKDVVKGIKKRISSRNAKVQLLALTLLETLVKNCGDVVHMHVVERDVLHEMVKIVKKKPDFHVKEKILILVDTWQEAFGGPRARYPQYYAAYQELLRVGAVFPQRSESSAPVFTPPQTHPLSSYPQNLRNTESGPEGVESSAEAEFPTLSSTEIQNARGIMDVLAEMLNAVDPRNKEEVKQEVIVDLVEQCRTFKQRLVHLVNSTSDELLLGQGLALNDDMQKVLAKHEAISSGISISEEKAKPESGRALVDDAPLIDTGEGKVQASSSSSGLGALLALPAPSTSKPSSTPMKSDPKMDLLSGDDFSSPKAEDVLALVPVGETQPGGPAPSQQNALALVDMFTQGGNTQATYSVGQSHPSSLPFQQQQNLQSPQQSLYPNGGAPGATFTQNEQAVYTQGPATAWNGQILHQQQQQQAPSPVYGADNNGSLPPPPWEVQSDEPIQSIQVGQAVSRPQPSPALDQYPYGSQHLVNNQAGGMHMQPVSGNMPGNQFVGMHSQGMMQGGQYGGMYPQMQSNQMAYMYPQQMYGNQMMGYGGYGYGQQPNAQFLDQQMSGLSVRDDSGMGSSSYAVPTPSNVPSGKPTKPEDKLFGDLVDISKFKSKTTPGRAGSM
ncbi:transporter [Lithospermum erythrorhizon]|uniref:Transporter n=1 Tax=Lithospermum erythrorhizon TaxID=34254 RepID=A0AAV3P3S9_LITER